MTFFLTLALIILILSLCIGLIRIFRGPTLEDRIMSVQLMGTTGVGILLILGLLLNMPASIDIALVLAMLAAISVVALTRREATEKMDD
jgi:multicomponent Na+:H+ antiporter subunit F